MVTSTIQTPTESLHPRKTFRRPHYNEADRHGKEMLIELFRHEGYRPVGDTTQERFKDGDLIFENAAGHRVEAEAEVRQKNFHLVRDRFDTISVPARKEDNHADYFFGFNKEGTEFFIIAFTDIRRPEVRRIIKKCNMNDGEHIPRDEFFDVPKKYAKFFRLIDGKAYGRSGAVLPFAKPIQRQPASWLDHEL